MDTYDIDKIKHITNVETVRRKLIRYFINKGFVDSFDRLVYPPMLQDLPLDPEVCLFNKVEVVPYAAEIDTSLGRAILGWNLFVLGSNRMFLGETFHNNLNDLARQIKSGVITRSANGRAGARRQTTVYKIIMFITKVLTEHEAGYVVLDPPSRIPKQPGEPYAARQTLMGMPNQFFSRTAFGI
jgi:hypothetical protein